ncbi:MAG: hypothetical protein ACYTXI_39450 [Nostoc sp.]
MEPNQLNLFSDLTVTPERRAETLVMSFEGAVEVESRDFRISALCEREQTTTADGIISRFTPKHCDPDQIDPLLLWLVPMSFYPLPVDSPGSSLLYFIIDSAASVVSYVGETCRNNK